MNRVVKDVIGHEGLYQIDNFGCVESLPKKQGRFVHNKYRVMKQHLNPRTGYYQVGLSRKGKVRTFLVHRLLAIHFLPNPHGFPEINHINGIKTDNRLDNLEWITRQGNTKHAFDNNLGGFKDTALLLLAGINRDNEYVKLVFTKTWEFDSTREAAEALGLDQDNITRAIRNNQNVSGYSVKGIKRYANGKI